jgi:multidrug resistance efflux pump
VSDEAGELSTVLGKELVASVMAGLEIWRALAARRARSAATSAPTPDIELSRWSAHYSQLAHGDLANADEDLARAQELFAQGDEAGCAAAMVDHARHLADAAQHANLAERAGNQAVEVVETRTPALASLRTARAATSAARQAGKRTVERAAAAGLLTTTGVRPSADRARTRAAAPARSLQPAPTQGPTPPRRRPAA